MKYVWLVIQYDYEDSDVVAVATSRNKAYELRKKYLRRESDFPIEVKSVQVKRRELNTLSTIYGSS